MARIVFGMNQSLDGNVDHTAFSPGPQLFEHFIQQAQERTGSLYGARMYEIMRYWDDEDPDWSPEEQAYAVAWREKPKWVVSRSLTAVGPNASLVDGDLESAVRTLKAEHDGDIEVGGTQLAASLTELGLVDAFQIYLHPVVAGSGVPFFGTSRPTLRLEATDPMPEGVVRLTYVPA